MNPLTPRPAAAPVLLACVVFSLCCVAQPRGSVVYPGEMPAGDVSLAIGVSVSQLPTDVVGETASHLPMLRLESRVGLPSGYSARMSVGSIYLSNTVSVGAAKSYDSRCFSFSAGADVTYWFGIAKMSAFDMNAHGVEINPYAEGGVDLGVCRMAVRADLLFARSTHTTLDGASISTQRSGITGGAVSIALQKEIAHAVEIIVGARIQYAQPDHETWLAFSNPDRWNVTPKLYIGYML